MTQIVKAAPWKHQANLLTLGYKGERGSREVHFPIRQDISEPGITITIIYGQDNTEDTSARIIDAHMLAWRVPDDILATSTPGTLEIWADKGTTKACLYKACYRVEPSVEDGATLKE